MRVEKKPHPLRTEGCHFPASPIVLLCLRQPHRASVCAISKSLPLFWRRAPFETLLTAIACLQLIVVLSFDKECTKCKARRSGETCKIHTVVSLRLMS